MISPTRILLTAETRTQHESRTSNQVTNIKVFPTPGKWMRDSEHQNTGWLTCAWVKIKQQLNKLSNLYRPALHKLGGNRGVAVRSGFELISTWVHATRENLHRTYACMRLLMAASES